MTGLVKYGWWIHIPDEALSLLPDDEWYNHTNITDKDTAQKREEEQDV